LALRDATVAGPDRLTLSTSAAVYGENLRTIAEFCIAAGDPSATLPKSNRTDDSPFLDFLLFVQEFVDLGL
jgi:hypothetical protein